MADPEAPDRATQPEKSLGRAALDVLVYAPAGFLVTALAEVPAMADKGRERIEGQLRNARAVGQFAVTMGQREVVRRLGRGRRPAAGERVNDAHAARARAAESAGRDAGAGPDLEPQPEQASPRPDPGSRSRPDPDPDPDPGSRSRPDPDPGSGPRPDPDPRSGSRSDPGSGSRSDPDPDPGSGSRSDPGSGSRPERWPGSRSRPEPRGNGTGPPARQAELRDTADSAIPGYDTLSASQVVRRLDGLSIRQLEVIAHHEAANRRRRTIMFAAEQRLGISATPATPATPEEADGSGATDGSGTVSGSGGSVGTDRPEVVGTPDIAGASGGSGGVESGSFPG